VARRGTAQRESGDIQKDGGRAKKPPLSIKWIRRNDPYKAEIWTRETDGLTALTTRRGKCRPDNRNWGGPAL